MNGVLTVNKGAPVTEKKPPETPLHQEPTIKQRVSLRVYGSKIQMVTLTATIGGLIVLPEFAQVIGAGGAFAIAIENLLKARNR